MSSPAQEVPADTQGPVYVLDEDKHRRTLRFAVSVAVKKCPAFAKQVCSGGQSMNGSFWYQFPKLSKQQLDAKDVEALAETLNQMIKDDLKVNRKNEAWKSAFNYCQKYNLPHSAALLKTRAKARVEMIRCNGVKRLAFNFYNTYPSLGHLSAGHVELRPFGNGGFLAIYKEDFTEQPALASSFADHKQWGKNAFGVSSIGELNQLNADKGETGRIDYGMAAEFRQEQKLTEIARTIHSRNSTKNTKNHVRVLAIAGPTSSGKTTFAHKLSLYLKNFGYEAKALSVDHYYLNLADQPKFKIRGERTDVDYDSIESMDVAMVNDHINRLIKGEKVMTPQYDFKSGNRVPPGHEFSLPPKGILIIEGIHALNPEYTSGIPQRRVFKVYISPLSSLQLDDFNSTKTTFHRLLRRMTRDYKFRGYSCEHTLSQWSKVRRGEHKYIFEHQNNADYVMNSAMEHEVCILKSITEPLLRTVSPLSEQFDFAQEVLNWLDNFATWPEHEVGSTAIFREFIGNGAYDKH